MFNSDPEPGWNAALLRTLRLENSHLQLHIAGRNSVAKEGGLEYLDTRQDKGYLENYFVLQK